MVGLPETPDGAVRGGPGHLLTDLVAEADVVAVGPGLKDIDATRALLDWCWTRPARNRELLDEIPYTLATV